MYGAEALYVERAVTASVGTAEERAEQPELPPLASVEGDMDTGAALSSREGEAQAELLGSMPLQDIRSANRSGALCGLACLVLFGSPFMDGIAT